MAGIDVVRQMAVDGTRSALRLGLASFLDGDAMQGRAAPHVRTPATDGGGHP